MPSADDNSNSLHEYSKGGLISERFSFWLKISKKVPNHEHVLYRWIVVLRVTWHIFEDLLQTEKLSEIKSPLMPCPSIGPKCFGLDQLFLDMGEKAKFKVLKSHF